MANGETVETVTDFIFLGSKITEDGDCSHEIKKCFLPGRKSMINLDSILKSRDIILPTKFHLDKDMVFPVVMYGYESWTTKKAERQRIDAFELWCWRRLLRVPWTAGDPASRYAVQVCHCFSSKEQASFNFMAAVIICSDFGAQENKVCHCFHCFPIYLP